MMNRRTALRVLGGTVGILAGSRSLRAIAFPGDQPAEPTKPFTLPPLPYAYDALEPWFDAETMHLHHDKHHQAYVNGLNAVVTAHPELAGKPVETLLASLNTIPEAARLAVRNQGGGHANHSFWWSSLGLNGKAPLGELAKAIDRYFGSFSQFEEKFTAASLGVFGSGWAWLVRSSDGTLRLESSANQDSPLTLGLQPLLGLDLWEHAYYLKYQNRRAEYAKAFFQVVDWNVVTGRFTALTRS